MEANDYDKWARRLQNGLIVVVTVVLFLVLFKPIIPSTGVLDPIFWNRGDMAAVLGTILLVLITWKYTDLTRQLVKETRRDRIAREERFEAEIEHEEDVLRQSLHREISSETGWESIVKEILDNSDFQLVLEPVVFDSSSHKIGLLDEEEIGPVLTFYQSLQRLNQWVQEYDPESTGGGLSRDDVLKQAHEVKIAQSTALEELKERIDDERGP
jgi:hypothetical protein